MTLYQVSNLSLFGFVFIVFQASALAKREGRTRTTAVRVRLSRFANSSARFAKFDGCLAATFPLVKPCFHDHSFMNVFSAQSHRTQLILAAVSASLLTSGLFTAYNAYIRRERRRNLDRDILRSIADQDESSKRRLIQKGDDLLDEQTEEEVTRERLARCYAFFGDEGMARVREKSVVVVGCGGVGSWVAVMLVRSYVPITVYYPCYRYIDSLITCRGVSKIRLVDFDYVTLSSLNRHATAVLADVGTPKVRCIERTLKQISTRVEVDGRIELWRKEDGGRLLEGADWVIGM